MIVVSKLLQTVNSSHQRSRACQIIWEDKKKNKGKKAVVQTAPPKNALRLSKVQGVPVAFTAHKSFQENVQKKTPLIAKTALGLIKALCLWVFSAIEDPKPSSASHNWIYRGWQQINSEFPFAPLTHISVHWSVKIKIYRELQRSTSLVFWTNSTGMTGEKNRENEAQVEEMTVITLKLSKCCSSHNSK